ncbi:4483_t:CDS:2 [Funneliformis geosporum]|uniref:16832_t:CDS:1 n=1 Tax=Funneliformis geosporum TaxID=1117311 RepID=A0A9W4SKH1_9GLOM|nr:4483_t:CDS:2 [Funneliformis geosporum]CAI2171604.1 16832_t:CDS:2 [Funneliformis geosporum]
MTLKFHCGLLKDISLMLNDGDDHNVIIQVGENQNTIEFRAHSNILKARSPYFKRVFTSGLVTRSNNMFEIKKTNINPTVFEMILKYIYAGEVDLTDKLGSDIFELLIASDELILEELFNDVQNYLIEELSVWIQKNINEVLPTAFKLTSCKRLQDHCIGLICALPLPFFSSDSFTSLDEKIIYCLLKCDYLQMDEILVWEFLIKWAIEQTPGLGSSREKWTEKSYKDLKVTLNKFIPLIRFRDISSNDFYLKVHPYEAIFPPENYESLLGFYLNHSLSAMTLPSRDKMCQIDSLIIGPNHVAVINNWIKREKGLPYTLLYRGSRDGIKSDVLKNRCYRQSPCLVLVKVRSSPRIFGGYSPIGIYFCTGGQWHRTSGSFIFSFEDSEDDQNMKVSRVTNNNRALYEFYDCAFNFGGGALFMDNDKNLHVNYNLNYQCNLDEFASSYVIKEVEVFKLGG